MARSGKPGRSAKEWNSLSIAYRTRLVRAGIDKKRYMEGASLQPARGHTPKPKGAAPLEATEREVRGEGGARDLQRLQTWAESSARPRWIPRDFSAPTAAALSQVDLNPKAWGHVEFTPRGDDQPWTMRITPAGAPTRPDGSSPYDRVIDIPGGGGKDTWGAREVLDWLSYAWDDYDYGHLDWDVSESG